MKTFQPNCTLPPPGEPSFVAGPEIRSTLDIVWACLSVIFLSTWSVLHLNVPPPIRSRTRWQLFRKTVWLAKRKLKWTLYSSLMPELTIAFGVDRFLSARKSVGETRTMAVDDGTEWTLTHALFADMDGFLIKFPDEPVEESGSGHGGGLLSEKALELQRHYERQFERMGSTGWQAHRTNCEALEPSYIESTATSRSGTNSSNRADVIEFEGFAQPLCGNFWVLNARQIAIARRHGIIACLPRESEEELADKSKSDGLVKLIAFSQLIWLVVQLIVRSVKGKPNSQLEIMTVSYAACAMVGYGLLWHQPQDVSQPVILEACRSPSGAEIAEITGQRGNDVGRFRPRSMLMPSMDIQSGAAFASGLLLGGLLYGLIHLTAWDFSFPTPVDRLLWRICSLVLGLSPLVVTLFRFLPIGRIPYFVIVLIITIASYASRIILLVETFRSLYYIEPAGYVSTWTVAIPHIG
ncbi:hypothetical protein B0H66DRAFT_313243 [Apodospora peruviana]|uniref:Uncharacterized protein n=1 Tax=Apodospora peruviana TaxID=516989 RepID=A0AAE0HWX3_9PEZI|nr:hypothetical protein B0H66DRAFT_313243 [Apodospora peruviana]